MQKVEIDLSEILLIIINETKKNKDKISQYPKVVAT